MTLDFWKIAMRPGKPLMFGRIGPTPVLGLPGNPVSSLVCAIVYLRPALRVMLGLPVAEDKETALAGQDLGDNDSRQDICVRGLPPILMAGWWPRPSASRTAP